MVLITRSPIEASQIFLKNRLRLYERIPIAETLNFIYRYKDCEAYYEEISLFTERMLKDVERFFNQDLYDLYVLEWGLTSERYKVTAKGRSLLVERLSSTYNDGMGYRIRASALRRLEIKPISELKPEILKSEEKSLEAAIISKRLCKKMGKKVCIT
jgi:hypothetical protein